MKEKARKALYSLLAIMMTLALCIMPKLEVKAVEARASTPIPVSVEVEKRVTFSDGYMLFVGEMTGTMVRGSDRTVISYDVELNAWFDDGEGYSPEILSKTKTVTTSGYGIIGKIVIKYNLKDYLGNIISTNNSVTIEIPCGV